MRLTDQPIIDALRAGKRVNRESDPLDCKLQYKYGMIDYVSKRFPEDNFELNPEHLEADDWEIVA